MRFLITLAFCLVISLSAYGQKIAAPHKRNPDEVLLLCNANSPVSRDIADDYARKRHIRHRLSIQCQDSALSANEETMTLAAYTQAIENPVRKYLASHPKIDFIVLTKGIPIRIVGAAIGSHDEHSREQEYNFSAFPTVVDVGGGHGTLLAAILHSNPDARGILLDLPHVVAEAERFLMAAGVTDRCSRISGDFFQAVAAGGDAYVLAHIIHDWDDERCIKILTQARRVIPASGKLLVIELVLPTGEESFFGKWLDLHMLVMAGGCERTESEFQVLLRAAGFEVARVVPTPAGPSVVEAIPV